MLKLIKFIIVGITNTCITFSAYSLFIYLDFNYLFANILSYFLGALNSYILNKSVVFKSNEKHSKLIIKFILVNLITLLINNLWLFILISSFNYNKYISQLLSNSFGIFINFFLNKRWTFKGDK